MNTKPIEQALHYMQCGSCKHWRLDVDERDRLRLMRRGSGKPMLAGVCLKRLLAACDDQSAIVVEDGVEYVLSEKSETGDRDTCEHWRKHPAHEWEWP